MNLKEKVGSLFMVGFDGLTPPPSLIDLIQNYFIGGVILFGRNIESPRQLRELISSIKDAARGRLMLIGVDCEGGRVFRLGPPFFRPPPMASISDPVVAYNVGRQLAEELKSVGFNIDFAPVLDVNTNIKNPVIGDRSFSNDPRVVARLGCEVIRGLEDGGVIACGKHFPGHGDTSSDSHEVLPRLPHTIGRLESIELIPFHAAIVAGLKTIMTAHVIYDGVDSIMPATLSPIIINDLLRRGLGFNGVVFSDDLRMKAITNLMSIPDASVRSLQAGCDVCLICRDNEAQKEAIERVINAVATGILSEEVINTSYRRVAKILMPI